MLIVCLCELTAEIKKHKGPPVMNEKERYVIAIGNCGPPTLIAIEDQVKVHGQGVVWIYRLSVAILVLHLPYIIVNLH